MSASSSVASTSVDSSAIYGPIVNAGGETRFSVNLNNASGEKVSIAMQTISAEKNAELIANNGQLRLFEGWRWKAIKVDQDHYILLNINSLKEKLAPFASETTIQKFLQTGTSVASLYIALEVITQPLSTRLQNILETDAASALFTVETLLNAFLSPVQIHNIASSIELHQVHPFACEHISPKTDALLPFKMVKTDNQVYLVFKQRIGEGTYKITKLALHLNTGTPVAYIRSKKFEDRTKTVENVKAIAEEFYNTHSITQREECRETVTGVIANTLHRTATKISYMAPLARGDLKALRNTLSEAEIFSICKQLIAAVNSLHQIGVVHRDLKLANVLLFEGLIARLTDLGLIDICNMGGWTPFCNKGSAAFLPPEICRAYIRGYQIDDLNRVKIDAWGLGLMLYQLHYRRDPPWFVPSPGRQKMAAVANLPETWLSDVDTTTPMGRVIFNLLQIHPDNRWTTTEALAELMPTSSAVAVGT